MKKLIILAAGFALVAGACGSKDKVDAAAEKAAAKVENAAETVADKAGEAKDAMVDKAKEATESYGSDSEHMANMSHSEILSKSCTNDGDLSAKDCACTVKVMTDNLSAGTLTVFATGTKIKMADGEEAGNKYMMDNMSQENAAEWFGVQPKLMQCSPEVAKLLQSQ